MICDERTVLRRRLFMSGLFGVGIVCAAGPALAVVPGRKPLVPSVEAAVQAPAIVQPTPTLAMTCGHTGESLSVPVADLEAPDAVKEIARFFRDWRQDVAHDMDPQLIRAIADVQQRIGGRSLRLISGFRTAKTNRAVGGAHESQHCEGKAADLACDEMAWVFMARAVCAVAEDRKLGRGFYAGSFCHLDVFRERVWGEVPGPGRRSRS